MPLHKPHLILTIPEDAAFLGPNSPQTADAQGETLNETPLLLPSPRSLTALPLPMPRSRVFLAPQARDHALVALVVAPPPPITRETGAHETTPNAIPDDHVFEGIDSTGNTLRWRSSALLGTGLFSRVVLGKLVSPGPEDLNLVAIKITVLPQKPQDRERLETSLQREHAILARLNHPCIVKELAQDSLSPDMRCLMLKYCPGGDLLELASTRRPELRPFLLRRLFAEVARAVRYLHRNWVVHRDIKLENVLVNFPADELVLCGPDTLPSQALITLTDFGLLRAILEEDCVLTTRCGLEDYVAPELLMGMPYDGRQTDVWALGVLLYALMEGRLPFDPPPPRMNPVTGTVRNPRVRLRTAHRIARIEWAWYFFAKPENTAAGQWRGAKEVVEHTLVKRDIRWSVEKVCLEDWVANAGGVQ